MSSETANAVGNHPLSQKMVERVVRDVVEYVMTDRLWFRDEERRDDNREVLLIRVKQALRTYSNHVYGENRSDESYPAELQVQVHKYLRDRVERLALDLIDEAHGLQ